VVLTRPTLALLFTHKPEVFEVREYTREFLELCQEAGVLRFGEFTLKSGRRSPYFFNAGLFNTGAKLASLGRFYALAVRAAKLSFDMLYGPAYKGIPLAAATAIALAEEHGRDLPYAFNRKEVKDHAEGGVVVGAPIGGRVLIVDDVISAGTSVRESVELIRAHEGKPAGVLIALDRQERGQNGRSAVNEVEENFAIPVASIACLDDLTEFLATRSDMNKELDAIRRYRERYGG
jgi:orotate phosphoribosyltransferase